MSSSDFPELLNLERGLPTTAADVAALRGLRAQAPMTLEDYFRWLATLPRVTREDLAARRGPRGEPFRLTD